MHDLITEICPGLWLGGDPGHLLSLDIHAVIRLCTTPGEYHKYVKSLLWLPLADNTIPTLEWLDLAVNNITVCRTAGWAVLIHCHFGITRSVFVTAAYLIKNNKITMCEAINIIRCKRPWINLPPAYVELLTQYEIKNADKICSFTG